MFLSSCSLFQAERHVTIREEDGTEVTAIIAPSKYCDMPAIGAKIPVIKPRAWPKWAYKDFIFNSTEWNMQDTSGSFWMKKEVKIGEVIAVN